MNWFKENPFVSGLIAVALAGAGALGYLILQASSANNVARESYDAAVTKLHGLQNRVPFPDAGNLAKMKESLAAYQAKINELQGKLARMEAPLDTTVNPQQFQDGLRAAVNALREKAAANNVKLPENFYFGFDQYQTQVPSDKAAPYLNRQLLIIQTIVNRLVDFKVASIDSLVRTPLPQEGQPATPATPTNPPGRPAPQATESAVTRFPFELGFTSEQSKFRVAFNSLLGTDHFLIVRSLSLANSSPQAPLRQSASAAAPAANPFAAASPTAEAGKTQNLQVILGRELVKVQLRLEMLDFTEPPSAKN